MSRPKNSIIIIIVYAVPRLRVPIPVHSKRYAKNDDASLDPSFSRPLFVSRFVATKVRTSDLFPSRFVPFLPLLSLSLQVVESRL